VSPQTGTPETSLRQQADTLGILIMKRKTILLLLAVMSCFTLSLTAAKESNYFQSGFYFGGALGASFLDGNRTDTTDVTKIFPESTSMSDDAINASVFAGYLHRFEGSNWALAFEPYAQIRNLKDSYSDYIPGPNLGFTETTTFESPWSGGLNLRFGHVFDSLFVYILGGVDMAHMKVNKTESGDANSTLFSDTKNVLGFNLGVGVEKEFENTHRLGLQVVHTGYKKTTFSGLDSDGVRHSTTVDPSTWSVQIRYSIPF